MNILALEPYYGGSHKSFIDKLKKYSSHNWQLYTLPSHKWKWRMMHSAYTFSERIKNEINSNNFIAPDIIFCSDMLNLAEFKGLLPPKLQRIPTIAYFHENQLAYPTEYEQKKDRYFGWINITTALAADYIWFNSEYHKNLFINECRKRIKKAPDQKPKKIPIEIEKKSIIIPQGVNEFPKREKIRPSGPLRILWAARWEFDKNPKLFFDALRILRSKNIEVRINVIGGGNCKKTNPIFEEAKEEFKDIIDNWGFIKSDEKFKNILTTSDIIVSTARHEFFGISVAEAVSAGNFPVVPHELAYPEVLALNNDDKGRESFFFDGTPEGLADKISKLNNLLKTDNIWESNENRGIYKIKKYYWHNIISDIDKKISDLNLR